MRGLFFCRKEWSSQSKYSDQVISVEIKEGVTSIWSEAFSGCSALESIAIPTDVTDIGQGAFYNCSSLESVTMKGSTPPTLGSQM